MMGVVAVSGVVASGPAGYRMDGRLNDSFRAMNQLHAADVRHLHVAKDGGELLRLEDCQCLLSIGCFDDLDGVSGM